MAIKFVSYDGEYPNLCGGTLVIKNGDKEYNMKCVLSSGGGCYRTNKRCYTKKGRWQVNKDNLPKELLPCISEIEKLVNENIEQGCCGGCL